MFPPEVYVERRKRLAEKLQRFSTLQGPAGLILFLGNEQSPINYADNQYHFRQDSSFLYFFGLDFPSLAAVIDIDQDQQCVFGSDLTVDDIIWTGPQPSLKEKSHAAGISETAPLERLQTVLKKATQQNRKIHFLPQYRPENILKIQQLLAIPPSAIQNHVSQPLIKAVVALRSSKTKEEIQQIEAAIDISYQMHMTAMTLSKPGIYERQVAAAMQALALSRGTRLAFPTIFSIHGQTLHNPCYANRMKEGDIVVNDSGAESALHYASDITRTIPVSGRFSQQQKQIYSIVLNAQQKAIEAIKPGVEFRDIHLLACKVLVSGLAEMGLMKGDLQEAVNAGAHSLFFQCGLGHMLGLDVHDMEALGEDYVGYTDTIKRNPQFGWRCLRLAKALQAGYVITVEPGVYFIPQLIEKCRTEQKYVQYINYHMVDKYKDFGGVRIEDDILVTQNGSRILSKKIPKAIDEIEDICSKQ